MAENIHDNFFRESFSNPVLVAELLRLYLPVPLVEALDLDHLQLEKDTFVDEELRKHLSDLLCLVPLKAGGHVFIYFLVEHKSWPDRFVALQLLRYMVRIWEQMPKTRGAKLPVIFPLVFYHGQRPWRVERRFSALFDQAAWQLARDFVPDYLYFLLDVSPNSETPINGDEQLEALLLTMRGVFDERSMDWLERVIRLLNDEPQLVEQMVKIFDYLVKAGRTDKMEVEQMYQQVQTDERKRRKVRRGFLESYFDEGKEAGLAEGLAKGALVVLQELLVERCGPLGTQLPRRLQRLSHEQIKEMIKATIYFQSRKDATDWLKQCGL